MADIEKQNILKRLMALCSRKEHCKYDIRQKLRQWKYEGETNEIIQILEEEKYIDEYRYAQAFVNDKFKFSKWGKIKIKYQLKGRQVNEGAINEAINNIDKDVYNQVAHQVITDKYFSLKGNDKLTKKKKTIAFALQRGFEMDLIMEITQSLTLE